MRFSQAPIGGCSAAMSHGLKPSVNFATLSGSKIRVMMPEAYLRPGLGKMYVQLTAPSWMFLVAVLSWVAFIVICAFFPIKLAARYHHQTDKPRLDVEDNYRKTIAQVLGGSALIFTFLWTILKDSETLDQARVQAAGQLFSEATKQLDNDKTRIPAIYALGQVAATRSEFHLPVTRTILAFIPTDTDAIATTPVPDLGFSRPKSIASDTQAAIDVLNRRNASLDDHRLNLQRRYLVGGDFRGGRGTGGFRGADFQSAILYRADFRGADLTDARFRGAWLADWMSYGMNGEGGWTPDKPETVDWHSWEKFRFVARFEYAKLIDTNFEGTVLAGAIFCGANLKGTNFAGANLSRADFRGAKNIGEAKWSQACVDEDALFDPDVKLSIGACSGSLIKKTIGTQSTDCIPDIPDPDLNPEASKTGGGSPDQEKVR